MILITADGPVRLLVRPTGEHLDSPGLFHALNSLPTADRWPDNSGQTWYVRTAALPALTAVLTPWKAVTVWHGVSGAAAGAASATSTAAPDGSGSWAEMLFAAVGSTRANAAFRALSRVLHPDASTGDAELMRALLAARSKRRTAS